MYLGRIVAIGKTIRGDNMAAYRVSSRSFPDRSAVLSEQEDSVFISQRLGATPTENSFIEYRCAGSEGQWFVVSNGSHTDNILAELRKGTHPDSAISQVLEEQGYELDGHCTPRIAGIIPQSGNSGWLGVVSKDEVAVQEIELQNGVLRYVSTNEHYKLQSEQVIPVPFSSPEEMARGLFESERWKEFEHPVTGVACVVRDGSFAMKTHDFVLKDPQNDRGN